MRDERDQEDPRDREDGVDGVWKGLSRSGIEFSEFDAPVPNVVRILQGDEDWREWLRGARGVEGGGIQVR